MPLGGDVLRVGVGIIAQADKKKGGKISKEGAKTFSLRRAGRGGGERRRRESGAGDSGRVRYLTSSHPDRVCQRPGPHPECDEAAWIDDEGLDLELEA